MISKNTVQWNNNIENDGILYFAQRVSEMLDFKTIDIYRAPLLNTARLIHEYVLTSKTFYKKSNLCFILQELIDSFKHDIIIWNVLSAEKAEQLLSRLNTNGQPDIAYINYLDEYIGKNYFTWCVDFLKTILPQRREKKKIEKALRCFLPELFFLGYSREELYTNVQNLFFNETVEPISTLETFFSKYDAKVKKYKVYVAVTKTFESFIQVISSNFNACITNDSMAKKLIRRISDSQHNRSVGNLYYILSIEEVFALDAFNAARDIYEKISLFTSYFQYLGDYPWNYISNQALVVFDDGDTRFVNTNRRRFSSEPYDNPPEISEVTQELLGKLFENQDCSINELNKIIQVHNVAISNNGIENGFLNLWSILEMIFCNGSTEHKDSRIVNSLVPILQFNYFLSVLIDIEENVEGIIDPELYERTMALIDEDRYNCNKLAYLILLPKYNDIFEGFLDNFMNYPVLRSRLLLFHDECKNRNDLYKVIKKYGQRVKWHLYRIYRARNAITHSGNRPAALKDLGEHLHSYVDCIVFEIIKKLSSGKLNTIKSVIVDCDLYAELFDEYFNSSSVIDESTIQLICETGNCVIFR